MSPEDYREQAYTCVPEEVDTDVSSMPHCHTQVYTRVKGFLSFFLLLFLQQTKLSRLCEQDKVVRAQEDKLQQLYREKVTPHTSACIVL